MSHSLLILILRLRTTISPPSQREQTLQSLLHPLPPHSPSHSPPLPPFSFFGTSSRQLQLSNPSPSWTWPLSTTIRPCPPTLIPSQRPSHSQVISSCPHP